MKSLIIFDLDGTLAESKSDLDGETATLLPRLVGGFDVASISGGAWGQFENRFAFLPHDERWKKLYSEDFSVDEMKTIIGALDQTMWQAGFMAEKALGRADRRQRQSNRVLNTWPGCAAGEKEK